jgi:hypothetical protein
MAKELVTIIDKEETITHRVLKEPTKDSTQRNKGFQSLEELS